MSRWFRHYAGMMRDDKLVGAAIRSKQSVERVVWIWGAILESASEINDDGIFRLDSAEVAYFLRADEADVRAVLSALTDAGRVAGDRVVKWSDRQFKSDQSAERQAKFRDRRRAQNAVGDDQQTSRNGGVTSPSQPSDAPETETDTEPPKPPTGGRRRPLKGMQAFAKRKSEIIDEHERTGTGTGSDRHDAGGLPEFAISDHRGYG